jgi:hypothetical protein
MEKQTFLAVQKSGVVWDLVFATPESPIWLTKTRQKAAYLRKHGFNAKAVRITVEEIPLEPADESFNLTIAGYYHPFLKQLSQLGAIAKDRNGGKWFLEWQGNDFVTFDSEGDMIEG